MDSLILIALGVVVIGCFLWLATANVRNSVIDSWPFVIMSVFVLSVSIAMITITLLVRFDREREMSDIGLDIECEPKSQIEQHSVNRAA